jgi:3alpha(or 20beta)-hydroxysteroid dehydrogenase
MLVGAERISDQTAIVTGGSRGQGAAEVRRVVAEGAHVVIADVRVDDGERLAAELGPRTRFVPLDVSDASAWPGVLELPTDWPPIRSLVNNAGVHWSRPIVDEDPAEVMKMWSINQLGPLIGIKTVASAMRAAGGGSIVNVSSAAGLTGLPGHGAYGASKWALRGITRTAALELGSSSIRVNSIHPGPIDTEMIRSPGFDPAFGTRFTSLPLARCGTVEEIADLVLFLLSDESRYITGAEIAIDGGLVVGPRPAPADSFTEREVLDGA